MARLHRRRPRTSSLPLLATFVLARSKPSGLRRLPQTADGPASSTRACSTPSPSASSRSSSSIALIVPTAYWVRLKVPRLRPVVEFVTLLPFVVPPVVLVFGLIRVYSGRRCRSPARTSAATSCSSWPTRSCRSRTCTGPSTRAAGDRHPVLTEAAQSLGAGWFTILWRVILPNLRSALLSGAFLTLAIVIGEYTIATFLARPAFGPTSTLIGGNQAYEPAAVSLHQLRPDVARHGPHRPRRPRLAQPRPGRRRARIAT